MIERETYQEKIIHTTDHVHEVEHLNDQHHGATVAPAISMADFEKSSGGMTDAGIAKALLKEDKLKTQSSGTSKKVSLSEAKGGQTGAMVDSKKRNAPGTDDDIEAATAVGKLDTTTGNNSLSQ